MNPKRLLPRAEILCLGVNWFNQGHSETPTYPLGKLGVLDGADVHGVMVAPAYRTSAVARRVLSIHMSSVS